MKQQHRDSLRHLSPGFYFDAMYDLVCHQLDAEELHSLIANEFTATEAETQSTAEKTIFEGSFLEWRQVIRNRLRNDHQMHEEIAQELHSQRDTFRTCLTF